MENQQEKPLISVIITVYNMEKYLSQCVDSVLAQNYHNLDVVLVDDGSKDTSSALCDAYAVQDGRVQVIHKENGGLVSAWMAGVENAKGKYLVFVDSDDWVDTDLVEKLLFYVDGNSKEIICSNYIIEKRKEKIRVKQQITSGIYNREQIETTIFPELLGNENRMIHFSRCMKLISKELILDNMKYCNPKVTMAEDLTIIFPSILDAERIVIVEDGYNYHYRFVGESMVHHYDTKLYEKITLLYLVMTNMITHKICIEQQDFWIAKWQKEYVFLLLLVIKNELRGPSKGVKNRIVSVIKDIKAQEYVTESTTVECGKKNQILYKILKNPSAVNIIVGKLLVNAFDYVGAIRNR